jgi:hypothetical protein
MHDALARSSRAALFAATISTFVAVAGCGGGGGTEAAPPPSVSLSGVVIDGPIQGATVCLDLDGNGRCDAGEPASTPTDTQGRYTIAGLTSAQVATAPLLAVIPASAIDADKPGTPIGVAYTLGAPAGKGGVISPLTHLVQAAVARGKTLVEAEAGVASQVQVPAGKLYDDYTVSSSGGNAAIAAMAPQLVRAIRSGAPLSTETVAGPDYLVANLVTSKAGGHYARYYFSTNVPDANGLYAYYELRRAFFPGPTPLYESDMVFATPQGWTIFDGSTANVFGHGSPYRSVWGGTEAIGTRTVIDVAGQPIAQVVAMTQDLGVNTHATVTRRDSVVLSGAMPPGATVVRSTETVYATPVSYSPRWGVVQSPSLYRPIAGIDDLLALHPVSSPGSARVFLGLPWDQVACGSDTCVRDVHVQFGAGQTVAYVACDTSLSSGTLVTCQAAGTGHYTRGVAVDGTTPILTLTDAPTVVSSQATQDTVFVERNGKVYTGWKDKPYSLTRTMLGRIAFEAVAARLGITPIAAPGVVSPATGRWSATLTGVGGGTCPWLTIDAVGWIVGQCTSGPDLPYVFGNVSTSGSASFDTEANAPSAESFTGNFGAAAGAGTWIQGSASGAWTATRRP